MHQFQQSETYRELFGVDGEPVEFEWNFFQGLASLVIHQRIQKYLQDQNIEPQAFGDRSIFMSMFNDIEWTRRGNADQCISNSEQTKNNAKRFSQGHWTFLGPGSELKLKRTQSDPPTSRNQDHQCFGSWNFKKEQ